MANAKGRIVHKQFRLNALKLKRTQKLLNSGTETETVERALDLAISEYERNRLAMEAHDKFLRSGIVIRDVYGVRGESRRACPELVEWGRLNLAQAVSLGNRLKKIQSFRDFLGLFRCLS